MSAARNAVIEEMTRGQKLWSRLLEERATAPVSLERARLLTLSYRQTEGLSTPIRRGRAFEKIVTEIPIYIDDDQLIVGDPGSKPMAAEWFPEYAVGWVLKEFESGQLYHRLPEGDELLMKEIFEYWKDKSVRECFERQIGKENFEQLREMGDEGAWIFAFSRELEGDKSWYVPDYVRAIRKGLLGILAEVEGELQATPVRNEESFQKKVFLEALAIVLKAGIQYGKRYATLARSLAKRANGARKVELERIAEICEWVPGNPARSFHEALQMMWFCHLMIFWDTGGANAAAPGRVDQYFYPYYKRDIEEGRLTDAEAIELLECFRVKMNAFRMFRSTYSLHGSSGEAAFLNCTLGGETAEGKDAVNELSYLWIEAALRTRTPHPTLSIRWHDKLSPDFAMKAAELNRLGLGYPAWFGSKSQIQYLIRKEVPLEEALDYALAGCVLSVIPGKAATAWPMIMSMPKILELALHDGFDPVTKKQFGPKTGKFEDFESYEEVYGAYKEQVSYFVSHDARILNEVRVSRSILVPQLAASLLFDDCVERGQNSAGGGSRYQHGSMYLLPIGIIDVADSLAAIKKCVFEDGSIDRRELLHALAVNFQGKEGLRKILLSAPKYGNDDDYVDHIAADLYSWVCTLLDKTGACYGARYVCAPHSISFQGPAGKKVGALPSGRLAGLALADGGVSPCQGIDRKGPTAAINSACKIDHVPIFGSLFNMKFHPSALRTREDLLKFLSLIRTYLGDYGGQHIQFNVIDRETLLDAQRNPEAYRSLVIRVAGYSALFVELHRDVQDEIIKRTEHGL